MMNFNMVTNELEMLGNIILALEVKNNITNYSSDFSNSFGLDVKSINIDKTVDRKIGKILLSVVVLISGNKNEDFKMDIDIGGIFSTGIEKTDESFLQLLYINGVTALLGILRGKIEAITANVFNGGKVSIPFVNVLDYYKDITSKK